MRARHLLFSTILAGATAAWPLIASAQVVVPRVPSAAPTFPAATQDLPQDPPQAPPQTAPADANPAIDAIRDAKDPSSAIGAYAKATASDTDNLAAEQAFVERMVSFGLPEMAESQAQDVARRDPNNGVAWAVVGYMSAKRGDQAAGLTALATAAKRAPQNTFVLRTAAEMLAWYDTRTDQSKLPDSAKAAAEALRKQVSDRQTYLDAYAKAKEAYQRRAEDEQANAPEQAPPANGEQPAAPPAEPTDSGVALTPAPDYVVNYAPPPVYTDPYAYAVYPAPAVGYAYPSYWYPSCWYSDYWWWPTFSFSFGYFSGSRYGYDHGGYHYYDHDRDYKDGRGGRDGKDGRDGKGGRGGYDGKGGRDGKAGPGGRGGPDRRDATANRNAPRGQATRQRPGDNNSAAPRNRTGRDTATARRDELNQRDSTAGRSIARNDRSKAAAADPGRIASPRSSAVPRSPAAPRNEAARPSPRIAPDRAPRADVASPRSGSPSGRTPSYSAPRSGSSSGRAPSYSAPRSSPPNAAAPRGGSPGISSPRSSAPAPARSAAPSRSGGGGGSSGRGGGRR